MEKNAKKLIVLFMATLFVLALFVCLTMTNTLKHVKGESDFSNVQEVPEDGGFSEIAGASISVINGVRGIRFITTLTKEYHNTLKAQGEVSYISVMTGNGVSVERTHAYDFDAYFTNNDELDLFATLRFDKENEQITDWARVYGWDFTVDTYALVNGVPVAKATESNTVRSMREVANTAYYTNDIENDFYQSEVLKSEYLSDLTAVNAGYTDNTTNTTVLNIDRATFTGETVYVYDGTGANAKRVEAVLDNGNLKITDELTGTDGKEFTVFDDNNKAFRVKTALGTEIKDVTTLSVLNTATTGNYFLSSDITMTDTWTNSNPGSNVFTGVFDGMGYTIKDIKTTGLFNAFGGTIKNVAFDNAAFSASGTGIIAQTVPSNKTAVVENVAIKIKANATNGYIRCGAITRYVQNAAHLIMRNSIIEMNTSDNQNGFIAGMMQQDYTRVLAINCYFITNNMLPTGLRNEGTYIKNTSQLTDDTSNYTNFDPFFSKNAKTGEVIYTLVDIEEGITRTMKNSFNDALKKTYVMYTEIDGKTHIYNAKDLEVLKTATTGTFVLENDIDMAGYTDGTNAHWTNANATAFAGVLNGQGYVIKNLKTTGLFKSFVGTVKNIGFLDASYVQGGNGIIADIIPAYARAVVSNVIITGIVVPSGATYTGAIARQLRETAEITLENVLIEVQGNSNNGIAFGIANYYAQDTKKIIATNCYFVSNNMTPITNRSGSWWNSTNWGDNYVNVFSGDVSGCHFINIAAGLTDTDIEGFTTDMKALYDYMFPATA